MIRTLSILITLLISIAGYCQPGGSDFENHNSLSIHQILTPDSSSIIFCSDFVDRAPDITSDFDYIISFYSMKNSDKDNFDSIQEKQNFKSNFWKCDYAIGKAHEGCRKKPEETKYPKRDSVYNNWSYFAGQTNSDSLFSEFITGRKDSLMLDTMRSEILYRGYSFGLDIYHNELIVIEETRTGNKMKILIVGHLPMPEFYIETIRFRPGNFKINLYESSLEQGPIPPGFEVMPPTLGRRKIKNLH